MAGMQIGRVTLGGRVHLRFWGSRCPVVAHRPIAIPAVPGKVQPESVCKHCARDANLEAAFRDVAYAPHLDRAADDLIRRITEAKRTPEETARLDALAVSMRESILAARAEASRPQLVLVPVMDPEPMDVLPGLETVAPERTRTRSWSELVADWGTTPNAPHLAKARRRAAGRINQQAAA